VQNGPERYAVYVMPEEGSELARFGAWWLGREVHSPDYGPLPDVGLDPVWQEGLIADARLYGFHGTLKAPFRLAEGATKADLAEALAQFAASQKAFTAPPLSLQTLHGFLALRPSAPSQALDDLAGACVCDLDPFRAPPSETELAKRRKASLDGRHEELMALWGYPYVLDQFRFHLTLTRRIEEDERERVRRLLEPALPAVLAEPFKLRSICLAVQPGPSEPFVLAERFPLGSR
jgi:putative phosphonate metabolism protein